ncbi:MAG: class F sortase [Acidimicrobiales bacterium]
MRRWFALSLLLFAGGSISLGFGLAAQERPPAPSHNLGSIRPSTATSSSQARTPAANKRSVLEDGLARSVPVALDIPAIDVAAPLTSLGLNPDGTVQVPSEWQEAGWYRLGPTPGQLGAAVILGHVDSVSGPAVFFRLGALRPGETANVTLADGVVAHFVVDAVDVYPKNSFPARSIYEASPGRATLQLVTCTGEFDASTHHYLSNLVVYTSLSSVTPPRN